MKNAKFLSVTTTCLVALLGIISVNTGWSDSVENKIKDWIDDSSEALKNGVAKLGDDFDAIQNYLDNYPWKGLIEEKATSGPATLKHLDLNGHSKAVIARPGERIEGKVTCKLDAEQCSPFSMYRIIIGIKGEGAQAVIGNEFGLVAGKSRENFTIIAPEKPGMYQIRFRSIEALSKTTALDAWKDERGDEPDGKTTIGLIFVK